MNNDLETLHINALSGDEIATREICKRYERYIKKYSYVNGKFDEDVYQDLYLKLLECIQRFRGDQN